MAAADRIALVLGARNLGGAIAAGLAADGWRVAAVARSADGLAGVRGLGLLGIEADVTDPSALDRALAQVGEELGPATLVVNAVSASRRRGGGTFGGGPLADADLEGFRDWAVAVAEQAFVFLNRSAAALRDAGRGGTLVQVTGGSSRRAMPGRGSWAAGAFASRALVQAAAQELREEGIQVALLVVDGTIESPKTAPFTGDAPSESLVDQADVAGAVAYLAGQSPRAMTHELVVTPQGDRWVP